MQCEVEAPAGYDGEIKTAVRWCSRQECVEDEALANGVGVDAMWRSKLRCQAAWRQGAPCIEPHT
jgi:hypothetical protein